MSDSNEKRVLVVGMGVSGLATAARLHRAGWTPVVVERSPSRRSGGYFVLLFGAGRAAARRLGILDAMHDRTTTTPTLDLDRRGRVRPGVSMSDLPGQPWMMLRGDAEKAAYSVLPDEVEIRFSTVPTSIEQDGDDVWVTLRDTSADTSVTERFDLVVGADGVRSTVRALVFGPHDRYLKRLNYMIAAFQFPGTPTDLVPTQGATLFEPGRSMWVFPFADHDPTVLLTYRTDDVDAEFTQPPADRVRAAFGPAPLSGVLAEAVAALESADTMLFDSVEQVRMDSWHRGRVLLIGDAAWCVSLYAGMGVSTGFAGADLLGTMLERHSDIETALSEWEAALRPFLTHYQDKGIDQRRIFVMDNRFQIMMRRALPLLSRTRLGKRIADWVMDTADIIEFKNADIVGKVLRGLPPTGPHERITVA
ncbi:FAD-dependent monooxygenase [Nocardia goodfellowii]